MSAAAAKQGFRALVMFVCLLLIAWSALTHAQEAPRSGDETGRLSPEVLQAARKQVEDASELDETLRAGLLQRYDDALARFQSAQALDVRLQRLDTTLREAPARIEQLRQSVPPPAPLDEAALARAPLERLQSLIVEQESAIAAGRDQLQRAEDSLSRLLGGSASLSEQIAGNSAQLERIAQELAQLESQPADLSRQATELSLLAQRALRERENALNHALITHQSTLISLAQSEREQASGLIAAHQAHLLALTQAAQERREAMAREAREAADQLQQHVTGWPDQIRQLAESNRRLRAELETLIRDEQQVDQTLHDLKRQLDELRADFERIRQRTGFAGHSVSMGDTLRIRRATLPTVQSLQREKRERATRINTALHRQLTIDDLLRTAARDESTLRESLSGLSATLDDTDRTRLLNDAETLLQAHHEALDTLQAGYGRHIAQLSQLDIAARDYLLLVSNYTQFIDKQLLWMPGTGLLSLFTSDRSEWGAWLSSPEQLRQLLDDWRAFGRNNPLPVVLVLGGLIALLAFNRNTAERLRRLNQPVRKVQHDRAGISLQVLLLTVLKVLPLPALMLLMARAMDGFTSPLGHSLALGLEKAALLLLSLSLLRTMCHREGLGRLHFGWPAQMCSAVRGELNWFIPLGAVSSFLVGALGGSTLPVNIQAGSALAFALLMFALMTMMHRLFGRRGQITPLLQQQAHSMAVQLRFLWYPLLLGVPLLLALASLAGYHYTAVPVEARIQTTLWFLFGVFIGMELILRWLYVAERRLRHEDALRRREEMRSKRESEEDTGRPEGAAGIIVPDVPEVNFDSLSEQSRHLVRTGFLFTVLFGTWGIWADLIPALSFLQGTQLPLNAQRLVDGVPTTVPITLGDIVVGLFIVAVTFLAARNLPGLLEISLLQRLPLDAGARYAITTLSQYFIVGVGLIVAFRTMGLQWSGLQWLVAALGVGLGFGLQEIVANFVSGIILLFERPIRVGDVVTIDGTTGVVTRIQIRATTITNYDKQELVVPNKSFITGRLINWTLSDRVNRILLPVGLAYDGDVERALALLKEAATDIPEILSDPGPVASFEAFGNDALMLYLRAYLPNLDNRLSVITQLHTAIHTKFRAAGLEIAFPQRDVHVDIKQPLEIRLQPEGQSGNRLRKS